jgi:hypothetical protein
VNKEGKSSEISMNKTLSEMRKRFLNVYSQRQ